MDEAGLLLTMDAGTYSARTERNDLTPTALVYPATVAPNHERIDYLALDDFHCL